MRVYLMRVFDERAFNESGSVLDEYIWECIHHAQAVSKWPLVGRSQTHQWPRACWEMLGCQALPADCGGATWSLSPCCQSSWSHVAPPSYTQPVNATQLITNMLTQPSQCTQPTVNQAIQWSNL